MEDSFKFVHWFMIYFAHGTDKPTKAHTLTHIHRPVHKQNHSKLTVGKIIIIIIFSPKTSITLHHIKCTEIMLKCSLHCFNQNKDILKIIICTKTDSVNVFVDWAETSLCPLWDTTVCSHFVLQNVTQDVAKEKKMKIDRWRG